jgi:hypothetical protein
VIREWLASIQIIINQIVSISRTLPPLYTPQILFINPKIEGLCLTKESLKISLDSIRM